MRGRVIYDIQEFAPEDYSDDPNEVNEAGIPGDILTTSDYKIWLRRDSDWVRLLTSIKRWDDLRVPASSLQIGVGAGATPTWDIISGYGNIRFLMFDNVVENEVFLAAQLPHNWAKTNIKPHIHVIETGGAGTSRWGLEYSWGNPKEVLPSPTTIYAEQVANGSLGYQDILAFPELDSTGKVFSSMFKARIFRDAANDTYNQDMGLLEFDIHYQTNSNGTLIEFPV